MTDIAGMSCAYYKGIGCSRTATDPECPCVTYIRSGGDRPGMLDYKALDCRWGFVVPIEEVSPLLPSSDEPPSAVEIEDTNDINSVVKAREKVARLIGILQAMGRPEMWRDILKAGYEYRDAASAIPLFMVKELPRVMREEELFWVQVETLIDYPPVDEMVFDRIFRKHLEAMVYKFVLIGKG